VGALELVEKPKRVKIAGTRPHLGIKTWNRFDIVVENIRFSRDDGFELPLLMQKIVGQNFNCRRRSGASNRGDRARKMSYPAIIEIVAIDRGDDDVRQPECCRCRGDALRLVRV